ncbi:hypothetical protein NXS19_005154 [Fusarium pseudograminearum]|nr:hypothetical protein NXS19_005154 [Fusarium pseudograminearum]
MICAAVEWGRNGAEPCQGVVEQHSLSLSFALKVLDQQAVKVLRLDCRHDDPSSARLARFSTPRTIFTKGSERDLVQRESGTVVKIALRISDQRRHCVTQRVSPSPFQREKGKPTVAILANKVRLENHAIFAVCQAHVACLSSLSGIRFEP